MKVLIFGATGMIGRGVLLECLRDTTVKTVATIGRTATGEHDPKLREIVHANLLDYAGIDAELAGFDACFFCLGVSSGGMKEADYTRVTYDIAIAAAETLCRLQPGMTFVFVSGQGTDSTEKGSEMWARVKGRTENALLRLPLKAYMFRPGFIRPLDGIESKTPTYRMIYSVLGPTLPLLQRAFPNFVLTTRQIGQAMLTVAKQGYDKPILEIRDIRRAAASNAE
jgi:uncharacterized protein YbjT (DUF2867 family)